VHCPLSWSQRLYDDCDSGCWLDDSRKDEYDGIWCYMPKWIKGLLKKWIERKEKIAWKHYMKENPFEETEDDIDNY
jgi:hypothetical protein